MKLKEYNNFTHLKQRDRVSLLTLIRYKIDKINNKNKYQIPISKNEFIIAYKK
jgi:hypothetical protein